MLLIQEMGERNGGAQADLGYEQKRQYHVKSAAVLMTGRHNEILKQILFHH